MRICSPVGGGIPERPLTGIFPYNGLRGSDDCRRQFLLTTKTVGVAHTQQEHRPCTRVPGGVAPRPPQLAAAGSSRNIKDVRLCRILYVSLLSRVVPVSLPLRVSISSLKPLTIALFVPRRKKCSFLRDFF